MLPKCRAVSIGVDDIEVTRPRSQHTKPHLGREVAALQGIEVEQLRQNGDRQIGNPHTPGK
jgi:hypothetical protein